MEEQTIRPVAHIRSDFSSKFGIPRQAGIVEELTAEIVFEPDFAQREAIRGIEDFSHLWLIWQFSENLEDGWSPTVRPPRLGGNERKGVFATRSPYRPNALGLSCVKLLRVNDSGKGMPTLTVAGADLMDGTPIFDIKPYIPYADCIPEASSGFAPDPGRHMAVEFPEELRQRLPAETAASLEKVLSLDPRPQYRPGGDREYAFEFADRRVRFTADGDTIHVTYVGEQSSRL